VVSTSKNSGPLMRPEATAGAFASPDGFVVCSAETGSALAPTPTTPASPALITDRRERRTTGSLFAIVSSPPARRCTRIDRRGPSRLSKAPRRRARKNGRNTEERTVDSTLRREAAQRRIVCPSGHAFTRLTCVLLRALRFPP